MSDKISDIKKNYSVLAQKHSLPEIDTLEVEFGLHDIESEKFPLVEIRKKMQDKIETFCGVLSSILEGDTTLSNIFEAKAMDDKNKTDLFRIFRSLMKYQRWSTILSLSYEEKDEARFIKEFTDEWKTIRPELKEILTFLKDSWDTDSDTSDEILNYLG